MDGLEPHLHRLRPDAEIAIEISPKRLARQGRTPDDVTAALHTAGFDRYRIENSYAARRYAQRRVCPPHPWPHRSRR